MSGQGGDFGEWDMCARLEGWMDCLRGWNMGEVVWGFWFLFGMYWFVWWRTGFVEHTGGEKLIIVNHKTYTRILYVHLLET